MLSMGDCSSCLVLDDELNVLPISKGARGLKPLPGRSVGRHSRRNTAVHADEALALDPFVLRLSLGFSAPLCVWWMGGREPG